MMEVNRDCPSTPSLDDLKPPIFTPRERSPLVLPNNSSATSQRSAYALNIPHLGELHSPLNPVSFHEQFPSEGNIAHQSSVITGDSFTTTYSSLQTMISQMQLKVAAAFLQETEYLQHREQRLEYEEQLLSERTKQLEKIRQERARIERDFTQIKDRLEEAVLEVTKFQTNGAETLRQYFHESRQIDERLSALISESMASLGRSRVIIQAKSKDFHHKSDQIRSELNDRGAIIRQTESAISMMLDLVHVLNQLNDTHSQDLSLAKGDFEKKHQDYIDLSQTLKHDWDIKKEIEQIRHLENEKIQAQKELYEQTLLLENLKTVLGKAIHP